MHFRRFAKSEARESPLYSALARAAAEDDEVLRLLLVAAPRQQRPMLLFAAVQSLLVDGTQHELVRYYPNLVEHPAIPEEAYPAFKDFCARNRRELEAIIATHATQTNEVRRCTTLLVGLDRIRRSLDGGPVALIEVGASAGLLLNPDRYAYRYGGGEVLVDPESPVLLECEVRGPHAAVPELDSPTITRRIGIDLQPLDARDPPSVRWLEACVWPEHHERRVLLQAALEAARRYPVELIAGDALEVLPGVLEALDDDVVPVVMHSATLAYFTPEERQRFEAILREAARRRPLYWLSNEGPGAVPALGLEPDRAWIAMALGLCKVHERECEVLARAHPHGRWLHPLLDLT
ncbi:MAG: DUF2332 domain-containing protein [Actinomycetota bacterium]